MTRIPSHAFGGIWRLTASRSLSARHLASLLGLVAVMAVILGAFLHSKNGPERYLGFVTGLYFTFLVPLMAFLSGSGALREDLKPASADYLFTRSLPRPLYLLFKYAAHLVLAQLDFLAALAVLITAASVWHAPDLGRAIPAMVLAQALGVAVFSALGFLFAVISPRFHVIWGLLYGGVVEKGFGNIPMQLNRLSMTHQIGLLLEPLTKAGGPAQAGEFTLAGRIGILLAFTAGTLLVAAFTFGRQEVVTGGRAEV